ncbi:MAG: hypothetical protein ACM3SY_18475, partial [Candidatus Omnitrophota bacterium]
MSTHSRLIEEKKKEELLNYKNMTPEERIAVAIAHNKFLKELCYAGLTELGFKKDEIREIYQ